MDNSHEKNNFDFLRILAASFVIISHSFPLLGLTEPAFRGISLGALGVFIFFIISGFLISKSWDNNNRVVEFLWKRFLRIIPGLVFASIVTTLIIGPLVTSVNLIDYFKDIQVYKYFISAICFPFWRIIPLDFLPGVFVTNLIPLQVNGSLWTLVYEWGMYLLLILLGILGIIYKKRIMIFLLTGVFIFLLLDSYLLVTKNHGVVFDAIIFFVLFFISSFFYYYNKRNVYSIKIVIFLLIILVISSATDYFTLFILVTLPYLVLFIAYSKILPVNKLDRYGDYSYGMYIFAWPVQQTLVWYLPNLSILTYIGFSFLFTFPLAFISWHLIESKALLHKNKLPDFHLIK